MLSIHKAYKALATVTIDTIQEINDRIGEGKPLSEAVLEFGQFIALLALAGGKDLDGGDEDDQSAESKGGG